jgi:hypothetical protein
MNESHYPPSPSYYRRPDADARDLVTPSYWTDSALVHLMRAGRKDGEPFADAVRNAFVCLALWFRSQGLPVPFYSDALDAAHKRIAELEAAALIAVKPPYIKGEWTPRPVAPTLDTPAVEWTDAELWEWATAKYGKPAIMADGDSVWPGCGVGAIGNKGDISGNRSWFLLDTGATRSATEAARILNATKPGSAP